MDFITLYNHVQVAAVNFFSQIGIQTRDKNVCLSVYYFRFMLKNYYVAF